MYSKKELDVPLGGLIEFVEHILHDKRGYGVFESKKNRKILYLDFKKDERYTEWCKQFERYFEQDGKLLKTNEIKSWRHFEEVSLENIK